MKIIPQLNAILQFHFSKGLHLYLVETINTPSKREEQNESLTEAPRRQNLALMLPGHIQLGGYDPGARR